VKGIGAFSHGLDVYYRWTKRWENIQRMLTHLYIKDYGGIDAMIGYIHYQVVQTKLYIPLEMFRSSKHLTSIMLDITLSVLFL